MRPQRVRGAFRLTNDYETVRVLSWSQFRVNQGVRAPSLGERRGRVRGGYAFVQLFGDRLAVLPLVRSIVSHLTCVGKVFDDDSEIREALVEFIKTKMNARFRWRLYRHENVYPYDTRRVHELHSLRLVPRLSTYAKEADVRLARHLSNIKGQMGLKEDGTDDRRYLRPDHSRGRGGLATGVYRGAVTIFVDVGLYPRTAGLCTGATC